MAMRKIAFVSACLAHWCDGQQVRSTAKDYSKLRTESVVELHSVPSTPFAETRELFQKSAAHPTFSRHAEVGPEHKSMTTPLQAVAVLLLGFNRVDAFSSPGFRSVALAGCNRIAHCSIVRMEASGTSSVYDLLVIGGGSAGIGAAKYAAKFGKSVALIEKERFGGDCTWTGCVPSKTLLASARRAHAARTASRYGIQTGEVKVDMRAIKTRINTVIKSIYDEDDSPAAFEKLGVTAITGAARFIDRSTLEITPGEDGSASMELHAVDGILIATGAQPCVPKIEGLDSIAYLTYENVFDLEEVPSRLTVVGGGPIGCELAQAFSRLGAQVTLVADVLLPNDEPEAGTALEAAFVEEGITRVRGRAKSVRADSSPTRGHVLVADVGSKDVNVPGDTLLVAVGRRPVVNGMGLEALGIALNPKTGGIEVDKSLRTKVKGVFAAGDCTGDQQFTHYAGFQGAYAAVNAFLHLGPLSFKGVLKDEVPGCTFTAPEVASVGMKEEEAKAASDNVAISLQPLSRTDRAICDGEETHGFIKIVYRPSDGRILGATVVSPSAGEMISEFAIALAKKLTMTDLANVLHAYPSYSWAVQLMAADVYTGKLSRLYKSISGPLKRVGGLLRRRSRKPSSAKQ